MIDVNVSQPTFIRSSSPGALSLFISAIAASASIISNVLGALILNKWQINVLGLLHLEV